MWLNRELEDAETARKMMQDELLQIEREKLCRVMQDEVSVSLLCGPTVLFVFGHPCL